MNRELAIYDVIAPRLAKLAKRLRDVPEGFTDDNFADTVTEWASDFDRMLVEPHDLDAALEKLSTVSSRFPTYPEIMKAACGDDWATKKLHYKEPQVLWEEVIDMTSGRVIEVYPCIYPGAKLLTRIELKAQGVPNWDKMVDVIRSYMKAGRSAAVARETSERLGYDVKAGDLALERKPNVYESPEPLPAQAPEEPEEPIRSDLQEQMARLKSLR